MLNELKKDLPILVLEIGINHQGDVEIARDMMHKFTNATSNYPWRKIYFKFQKRTPREEVPRDMWENPREHPLTGKKMTYIEYKESIEFNQDDYRRATAEYSNETWYASVWGISSLHFMIKNFPSTPFIKIPSALLGNKPLIREATKSGRTIILSTGGATEKDVLDAYYTYHNYKSGGDEQELYVLACTSTYPTPAEEVNISKIFTLHDLLPQAKIGFSSHSVSPLACVLAAMCGAYMVEFHITLDRTMRGSDHAASIEPHGAHLIARDIMQAKKFIGNGELKPTKSELKKLMSLGK